MRDNALFIPETKGEQTARVTTEERNVAMFKSKIEIGNHVHMAKLDVSFRYSFERDYAKIWNISETKITETTL